LGVGRGLKGHTGNVAKKAPRSGSIGDIGQKKMGGGEHGGKLSDDSRSEGVLKKKRSDVKVEDGQGKKSGHQKRK